MSPLVRASLAFATGTPVEPEAPGSKTSGQPMPRRTTTAPVYAEAEVKSDAPPRKGGAASLAHAHGR
jgi:hypothetical protein